MCTAVGSAPTKGAGPYIYCPVCQGLSLDPYPVAQPNQLFEGAGGARRQQALEGARQVYFGEHLGRLERHLDRGRSPRRLLEIGCGSGVMLATARARGWQVEAVELSAELAAVAAAACPEAVVRVADVAAAPVGVERYDAVLALDVVEHVSDPARMLAHCFTALKPGGLLLIQTPNTRGLRARWQGCSWEMRDPAQHLNLFSPHGLQGLLTRTGFEVVSLRTTSGTGLERGLGRFAASVKQRVLGWAKLGNGILVLARRGAGTGINSQDQVARIK